ncbi:metal ABC transporter permease [Frigoribacterium sp. ACAM 257]|uniref:zinc ABC transporter permease AztB n=1 Tax=Frigoribacterium sp. ACAM 257 TaxID=2508998 RepID=UPI0011B9E470|nr:zinc ABC transporter permease AztB [Frigoribacterium sp. ACAM 257]TWX36180.1 metal ABC transporter permease [Frigoribacterium sp. ACAM 257]
MTFLLDPFSTAFMLRALVGGVLVAVLCGVVGTWVVVRGMAFLGEAMAHGVLPGVALAALLGLPAVLGAAVSAAVMTAGVGLVTRRSRVSPDTAIGLLYVAMLSVGVVIVSRSRSFATDLTAVLFGDVLAVDQGDLVFIAVAVVVGVVVTAAFHRPFVALAFDPRVASTSGLRPGLAHVVLVGLVTLVVVASYQAVGSLLVVGLLIAPAVAAAQWTRRIPTTMAAAALVGALAVLVGLLVSWHASTAAGASIAACAVALAGLSAAARAVVGDRASSGSTPDATAGATPASTSAPAPAPAPASASATTAATLVLAANPAPDRPPLDLAPPARQEATPHS